MSESRLKTKAGKFKQQTAEGVLVKTANADTQEKINVLEGECPAVPGKKNGISGSGATDSYGRSGSAAMNLEAATVSSSKQKKGGAERTTSARICRKCIEGGIHADVLKREQHGRASSKCEGVQQRWKSFAGPTLPSGAPAASTVPTAQLGAGNKRKRGGVGAVPAQETNGNVGAAGLAARRRASPAPLPG